MTGRRTGAHALLEAAAAHGIQVCFANPGTTELGLVRALDDLPAIRPVLGLFEGVCTGAADGYARATGRPAMTLLHLGPGFANGIANLHNARRARSAIVNVIGDHASWHLAADAPLTSDIVSLASPVSDAVLRLDRNSSIREQVAHAVRIAQGPPHRVVSLIVPSDLMDEPVALAAHPANQGRGEVAPSGVHAEAARSDIESAARILSDAPSTVVILGGAALQERGQRAAARIADACAARLMMECYPAFAEMGGDLPRLERLAYFPQDVLAQLGTAKILLADAKTPVSYFGYPGQPSVLADPQRIVQLGHGPDAVTALEQLAERLEGGAPRGRQTRAEPVSAARSADLTPVDVAEVLTAQLPHGAIVSLEGATCGAPFIERAHRAKRHAIMMNTGGAIGQGLPCAVGAALARPDARVVCLQSDGSAQYTLQALWTMARESLNVVVLLGANHRYGILQTELKRAAADSLGAASSGLTRIDSPCVDWVCIATGYGVRAARVATRAALEHELRRALTADGPSLIEMSLP